MKGLINRPGYGTLSCVIRDIFKSNARHSRKTNILAYVMCILMAEELIVFK